MMCAWKEFVGILPESIKSQIINYDRNSILELRLRSGQAPFLLLTREIKILNSIVKTEDLVFIINVASRYSPWNAVTLAKGYITAPGGHRIGICGECVIRDGKIQGVRNPSSLCIRFAKDIPGIAKSAGHLRGNLLILGPPGSGKTTLLRDLIRQISEQGTGSITVVDENMEIFPKISDHFSFPTGKSTDVMSGYSKSDGLNISIKTMSPSCIAVDEITSIDDCKAILNAHGCGVRILATAHASSIDDLKMRPIYRKLITEQVFSVALVLKLDKSWKAERIMKCT